MVVLRPRQERFENERRGTDDFYGVEYIGFVFRIIIAFLVLNVYEK